MISFIIIINGDILILLAKGLHQLFFVYSPLTLDGLHKKNPTYALELGSLQFYNQFDVFTKNCVIFILFDP